MKSTPGDLLEPATSGRFEVIVHGANCQCAMGAGIAALGFAAEHAAAVARRSGP
jgi:O-acetyl-ADP-ribose deacetylase (regulator of RNase III)